MALPDSWNALKNVKKLAVESNKIFEQQPKGALQKMLEINKNSSEYMHQAADELATMNLSNMMSEMNEKILELYVKEEKAINRLNEIIK